MANATKMETLLVAPPLGTETNGNVYVLGDVAQKSILLLLLGEGGGVHDFFFFLLRTCSVTPIYKGIGGDLIIS